MTIDPIKVSSIFDDWAERGRAEGMEAGHAHSAWYGFDLLAIDPGNRYLDIGCGNGYSVRWATEIEGVHATGIDVSPKMIERAREQSKGYDNCEFICDQFPSLQLPDASFDRVMSMEVFYYLPDFEDAMRSVYRLLRPAGRFCCIVDYYEENVASHEWASDMNLELCRMNEAQWFDAFEDVGFDIVEQRRVRAPKVEGKPDTWKQIEGSLLTYGIRPW